MLSCFKSRGSLEAWKREKKDQEHIGLLLRSTVSPPPSPATIREKILAPSGQREEERTDTAESGLSEVNACKSTYCIADKEIKIRHKMTKKSLGCALGM